MKEEEFLEHMVDAMQCYWSPFLMVGESLRLTLANAFAQGFGTVIDLTQSDEIKFGTMAYKENRDDITFGLVMRLLDWTPTHLLLIIGDPTTKEWYSKGMLIDRQILKKKTGFRRPKTH